MSYATSRTYLRKVPDASQIPSYAPPRRHRRAARRRCHRLQRRREERRVRRQRLGQREVLHAGHAGRRRAERVPQAGGDGRQGRREGAQRDREGVRVHRHRLPAAERAGGGRRGTRRRRAGRLRVRGPGRAAGRGAPEAAVPDDRRVHDEDVRQRQLRSLPRARGCLPRGRGGGAADQERQGRRGGRAGHTRVPPLQRPVHGQHQHVAPKTQTSTRFVGGQSRSTTRRAPRSRRTPCSPRATTS